MAATGHSSLRGIRKVDLQGERFCPAASIHSNCRASKSATKISQIPQLTIGGLALLAILLVALGGCAETSYRIRVKEGLEEFGHRWVLAPLVCRGPVNCIRLEGSFSTRAASMWGVDSAVILRSELFRRSLDNPTQEETLQVAHELGYDAVIFVEILESSRIYEADYFDSVSGSSELTIKSADGSLLARGTASSEFSGSGKLHRYITRQLIEILDRLHETARNT